MQARTDELTGLANRRALLAELDARLVAAAVDDSGTPVETELLLLDLDRFKEVNDSLGHAAGDGLLVVMAERLRAQAPGCLVARLGGDEFAVLLPKRNGTQDTVDGLSLAGALRSAVAEPVVVLGTRLSLATSIGRGTVHGVRAGTAEDITAMQPHLADSRAGELLRRADVALYRAKQSGNGCHSWEPALDAGIRDRLQLTSELREALTDPNQVTAWFQPKADPRTGVTAGFEALVRWQHPEHGLLAPDVFLPIAEQAGLMPQLTRTMLEQSFAMLHELFAADHLVHVAVNLSAQDLLDIDLVDTVSRMLDVHQLPASALRLEVTETVVMTDPLRAIDTLTRLCDLGVGLSLDDYGTGLSSLAYLRMLPVDELKIDRSFVRDLVTDSSCALIVASTIDLGHSLQMRVVAEGVEDQQTLESLARSGVDSVQGWHTGRPAPAGQARAELAARSVQRATHARGATGTRVPSRPDPVDQEMRGLRGVVDAVSSLD